ncbi:MAG: DegV family protein [Candidatus Merdivicinus sp.]
MKKVRIFTNSVSDLSPEWAEQEGITLIPDVIAFSPSEQFLNNIHISPPELYRRLASAERLPTTSHPNIDQYMQAFSSVRPDEEILCICLTSKMSGSFNTASTAAKLLKEQGFSVPITVYDSLQVSFGLAMLAVQAARMAKNGSDIADICAMLDEKKSKIGVYFVMESLQNARKGGRVGAIRVLAADLLNVKPVLMFRDGLVRDIGIVRGFQTALEKVIQYYRDRAALGGEVCIFHADRPELANYVRQQILAYDPSAKIRIEWVGAVIGIYTGAGCIGIAFWETP